MKYDIPYMTTEAVSLLKSLISIPSISREETQAADFLQNYIEMAGMQTGRKGNNVWCFSPMFDLKKPTILLNSHIDTVKPVNGWRKDPFTPREENGKLYGLGSNDAGASVVSLLQVFPIFGNLSCCLCFYLSEYMRVTENQFITQFVAYIFDVKISCFRAYLGIESNVQ